MKRYITEIILIITFLLSYPRYKDNKADNTARILYIIAVIAMIIYYTIKLFKNII